MGNRDYTILQSQNKGEVCDMVRNHLQQGWTVYGNLIVTQEHQNTEGGYTAYSEYIQAMIK